MNNNVTQISKKLRKWLSLSQKFRTSSIIIEAKINARKWQPEHQRSIEAYKNRRNTNNRNRVQENTNCTCKIENRTCEGAHAVQIPNL